MMIAKFMGPTWGPSGADRTRVHATAKRQPWRNRVLKPMIINFHTEKYTFGCQFISALTDINIYSLIVLIKRLHSCGNTQWWSFGGAYIKRWINSLCLRLCFIDHPYPLQTDRRHIKLQQMQTVCRVCPICVLKHTLRKSKTGIDIPNLS